MKRHFSLLSLSILLIYGLECCQSAPSANPDLGDSMDQISSTTNMLTDMVPVHEDGDVNAIIEIPAGSIEKWEINKSSGQLERDKIDGKPRTIKYLGYPANYGMIPGTLLKKSMGGDGDPLDILVLGPPVEKGSVLKCKIIGVLYLSDTGEQDDKLIGVQSSSTFYDIDNISQLESEFEGISDILTLWFTNYKGPGRIESNGFGNREKALEILRAAIDNQ